MLRGRCAHLRVALVSLPTLELVAEQQGAQLAVLVLDVVLDGRLARPAQLVRLLQVVPVHLDLLVVPALRGRGQRLRALGPTSGLTLSSLTSGVIMGHCPHSDLLPQLPNGTKRMETVTMMTGNKGEPRAQDAAGPRRRCETLWPSSITPEDVPGGPELSVAPASGPGPGLKLQEGGEPQEKLALG